jgi:hypothetical protein
VCRLLQTNEIPHGEKNGTRSVPTTMISEIETLIDGRLMPLGPGTPNAEMRPQLQALSDMLLDKAKDLDFALACMSGLWLYHDFLDESHSISQDLHTIEGSYWHAIMHRREPDYWNSKYWFKRVGSHPIYPELNQAILNLAKGRMWPTFLNSETWDPEGFVDLCEKQADPSMMAHEFCRRIQRIEWGMLFTYCHERAF